MTMLRIIFLIYIGYFIIGCQGENCKKNELKNECYMFERLGEIILKDNMFSEYLDNSSVLTNRGRYYRNFSMHSLNSSNFNYQDSVEINSIIDSLKNKGLFVNQMTIGRSEEILFTISNCFKDISGQPYSIKNTVVYNYIDRDPFKFNNTTYKIYSDSILSDKIRLVYFSMPTGH